MPLDATCPKCGQIFPVHQAPQPVNLECPGCDVELNAEFYTVPKPEPGESPIDMRVRLGRLPGGPPPVPTTEKPLRLDDEEDEPRSSGGGRGIVIFAALTALLIAMGGLGATGYVLFDVYGDTSDSTSNHLSSSSNNKGSGNTKPGSQNNTKPGTRPGTKTNPFPEPNDPTPPKPKETKFDLRPTANKAVITPPALPGDVSNIKLPGRVGGITVGGGGRYLIMHFPQEGLLGIFDANSARWNTVPFDTGDVKLAGGFDRVIAYVAGSKIYRVRNLPSLESLYDYAASNDLFFGASTIGMGNRTNGPLLVCDGFGEVILYDVGPETFKQIEGASHKKPGLHSGVIRAAPDGTAFATYDGQLPISVKLLTVVNRDWKDTQLNHTPYPGHDGNFYGNGVVVNKAGQDQRFGGIGAGSNHWFVPSVSSSNHFLKVAPTEIAAKPRSIKTIAVSVHTNRNSTVPVGGTQTYTNLPEFVNMTDGFNGNIVAPLDQHFFLIPEAKMLVILSAARTDLVIRKLEMK